MLICFGPVTSNDQLYPVICKNEMSVVVSKNNCTQITIHVAVSSYVNTITIRLPNLDIVKSANICLGLHHVLTSENGS